MGISGIIKNQKIKNKKSSSKEKFLIITNWDFNKFEIYKKKKKKPLLSLKGLPMYTSRVSWSISAGRRSQAE